MILTKLLYGYKATQCLYVAAKLNIADHLQSGSKSIMELADLTCADQESLYRVMRCLATLGIFNEESNQIFSLNTAANDLLSDSENTMKDFVILCGEELYRSAGDLLYTINTGLPAFNHLYGMDHWEYLEAHPDKAKTFHNAMEKGTAPMIQQIISQYDFSSYKTIIDVGGGKGHLVAEILAQYPSSRGTVVDLPNAKNQALEYISQKELTYRCNFVAANFFKSIPSNGDIYLLKVVLHDWDDEKAGLILHNCRKAMPANAKLLIIEKVIEDNKFKDLACLGDINMLVTLKGKERNLDEFRNLLIKTGFKFLQKINTKTVFSIIEAEPI